jgi:kynurenine formamidase
VIIHTGWGRLWAKDNARYMKGGPGIGVAAAEWLARQDPMLVGSDNVPVEISPNPDEFAFMMQPLKLKGATGSTVAPIAVR